MLKRTLVGIAATIILCILLFFYGWYIKTAAVIIALIIEYELIKTFKAGNIDVPEWLLYAYALLLFPAYRICGLTGVIVLQAFVAAGIFISGILIKKNSYDGIQYGIFSLYYPQFFFIFLYIILTIENEALSRSIIVTALASSLICDTAAYFIGTILGKHKLIPEISPKKTVEGAIAGVAGGTIASVAVPLVLGSHGIPLYAYAIGGVFFSIFSQFGDLSASLIKRHFSVKDYGSIMPGHGGMLDRLDSTLFILPIVYLFYKIYLNI